MNRSKSFEDNPPIDSNASGRPGAEKAGYEEEIGEEADVEKTAERSEENEETTSDYHSRKRRVKVTVQQPETLEALAEKLGSSHAGVYNTALGILAEQMGVDPS